MPLLPQAQGAPPAPMLGAPPMGGPIGPSPPDQGGGFPSTNPMLVAQLLGPLLQAQQQDEEALKQQQAQSVLMVLSSMKSTDQASADAASSPAPVVENSDEVPPQSAPSSPGGYG